MNATKYRSTHHTVYPFMYQTWCNKSQSSTATLDSGETSKWDHTTKQWTKWFCFNVRPCFNERQCEHPGNTGDTWWACSATHYAQSSEKIATDDRALRPPPGEKVCKMATQFNQGW